MLVNELGRIVDLIVDHREDVLLGVVLGNILVGVLLGSHFDDCVRVAGVRARCYGCREAAIKTLSAKRDCWMDCGWRWEVLSGLSCGKVQRVAKKGSFLAAANFEGIRTHS